MMVAILNSSMGWIQTQCFLLWDSLKNISCFSSLSHSHLPRLVPTICTKNLHSFILTQVDDGSHLELCQVGIQPFCKKKRTSLIHSDSTWWWQLILNSPFLTLTQTNCTKKNFKLIHSDSQLDDGSHLEFCPVGFSHLCFSYSQDPLTHLPTLVSPLWLCIQTNSIWLKLIHSDTTWWWQTILNSARLDSDINSFLLWPTYTCQD